MSNNPVYVNLSLGSGGTGTSGDPYGTWDLMLTGEQRSLTGVGELIIYVQGTQTKNSAGSFTFGTFSNATSSNYIHIKAWPGHEGDGTLNGTPGFKGDINASGVLCDFSLAGTRMTGVKVYSTATATDRSGVLLNAANVTGATLTNCICRASHQACAPGLLSTFTNCVFICDQVGACATFNNGTGFSNTFVNCTFIQLSSGGIACRNANDTTMTYINCATYGSWDDEYGGTASAGTYSTNCSNNAGQKTAASQSANIRTNYVQITSNPFSGGLVEPYRPTSGGQLAAGTATGTPTPPTTDGLGATRGATPYIGWLEGAAAPPDLMGQVWL